MRESPTGSCLAGCAGSSESPGEPGKGKARVWRPLRRGEGLSAVGRFGAPLRALGLFLVLLCLGTTLSPAAAEIVDPLEGVKFRLAAPIHNLTSFKVWRSRFDPTDVLPEKMTEYFHARLKEAPLATATLLDKSENAGWPTAGLTDRDAVLKLNLESANFFKRDTLGSRMQGNVFVRMTVYNGRTREEIFASTVEEKAVRWTPDYQDTLDHEPIVWKDFEHTAYWAAVRKALDRAFDDFARHYTGYRIVGRIAEEAHPIVSYDSPFSLGHARRKYLITLGRNDSLREGDILAVVKSEAVRTQDPENPVIVFPQVFAKVRVIFLKAHDGVVELVDKAKNVPIEPGDVVTTPLYGPRREATFFP